MLWLYNPNKEFKFYQIFTYFDLVYDNNSPTSNKIYSFETNSCDEGDEGEEGEVNSSAKCETNLDKINFKLFDEKTAETFIFDVRILDNIIAWIDIKTNKQYTFSMKMSFNDLSENELGLPIFSFDYKKINKNRMPTLINKIYDLSSQFKFTIYNINTDTQFIIETCLDTGIKKKYFITNDIKSIKKYLK